MLLSQQDFDQAYSNSLRFRKNAKAGGREISSRFKEYASSETQSLREFAQVLLLAFLARPHKIVVRRNNKRYRRKSYKLCRFVLDATPFSFVENEKGHKVLEVREEHLVKPLLLQSFLRHKFYSNVSVSYLKFGCLEIEYYVSELPANWVAILEGDADFKLACDSLGIKQFS